MKIVFDCWAHQRQAGYVFISRKDRDGTWVDQAFQWPNDKEAIRGYVDKHKELDADLYFAPNIFTKPKRRKENVKKCRVLYADLDYVDPRGIGLQPTDSWHSSDHRYQCLWNLNGNGLTPRDFDSYNRRLSYKIGADRGGWDITQVLRIPGTLNFKYDPPEKVKVINHRSSTVPYDTLNEYLRDMDDSEDEFDASADTNWVHTLERYKGRVPTKIWRMLQYPPERIEVGHRSDILWQIEHELIKARVPIEDVVVLVKGSAWNKYRGRADERTRIYTEVMKVYSGEVKPIKPVEDLTKLFTVVHAEEFMGKPEVSQGWLIRDLWLKRSHGIIAGEPKSYKSTIALDLAVSVASGVPLWGEYMVEDEGPAIFVQNENAPWIMRRRFGEQLSSKGIVGQVREGRGAGQIEVTFAATPPVYFINNDGFRIDSEDHRTAFCECIETIKPRLIVFDPLYLMITADLNSAKELQETLQWLMWVRDTYETAVMVVHHWNKSGSSNRGGQRMLGSTTLHGWAESGLYVATDGDTPGKVIIEREFRAAGTMPKLEVQVSMTDELGYNVEVGEKKAEKEMALIILNQEGKLSATGIYDRMGWTDRHGKRNIEELISKGLVRRVGSGRMAGVELTEEGKNSLLGG